jgi:hypothetical protein
MSGPICNGCGSSNVRLSHLRGNDLSLLFALRYPTRCRNCHERGFTSLWKALAMRRERKAARTAAARQA